MEAPEDYSILKKFSVDELDKLISFGFAPEDKPLKPPNQDPNELRRQIEASNLVLEEYPDDETALFNRGITKVKLHDYESAISDLTRVLDMDPKDAIAYYYRATAKINHNDYGGAVADTLKAMGIDPRYPAGIGNDHNDTILSFIETINEYTSAIRDNSSDTEAYHKRAELKKTAGDYVSAIGDYNKIIGITPCDIQAYSQRACIKNCLKDYIGAIADYTKIIEINSRAAVAYFKRGCIKDLHLTDYVGALHDFNKAIELSPQYFEAYLYRAGVKKSLNDNEGASEDYTAIINIKDSLDPENEDDLWKLDHWEFEFELAYTERAYLKEKQNDFLGAIADYTEALKVNPDSSLAYSGLADLKLKLKDYRGAIEDCTKLIEIDDRCQEAYVTRAKTRIEVEDYRGAIEDLEVLVKLNIGSTKES